MIRVAAKHTTSIGRQFPKPDSAVIARRCQRRPIRRKLHFHHIVLVTLERPNPSGTNTPNANRLIHPARCQKASVRRERQRTYVCLVTLKDSSELTGQLPQANRPVPAGGRDQISDWREGNVPNCGSISL